MSGYTPGPWTCGYGNYVYRDDGSPRDGQSLIATCMPLNGTMDELNVAFANARLIAAAPELLAALLEFVNPDYQQDCDDDGICAHCGRDNAGHENQPCSDDCPGQIARAAIAKAKGQ